MKLIIYHNTDISYLEIKEFSFSAEFMGDKKITATIYSPDTIDFMVNDYTIYRKEKFYIISPPVIEKNARTGENIGDAIKYSVEFYSKAYILKNILFQDYVTSDDTNVYYTGTSTFSFYNNVTELASRLKANLDRFLGNDVWTVTIDENIVLEEKQISINNQYLWDGLLMVNSVYELNFFINNKNIHIGGEGEILNPVFRYGKNKGLYNITKKYEFQNKVVTRLKTYGASRNLPQDYLRDEDSKGRYFTQLMLPDFASTGIDYVDAPQSMIDEYGIIEGVKTFDDVYPSIEEIDLGSGRIDEIVSVDTINPDSDFFKIHVRNLGFNILDYLTSETARISIKGSNADGSPTHLGGYEFEIQTDGVVWNGTGYDIELIKNNENGIILPDAVTTVKAGDRFVLLGIFMPDEYIRNAEEKLKTTAENYFSDGMGLELAYDIKIDEKFTEINILGNNFVEGKKLQIEDDDLGISNAFTIQTISIKYGNVLPTYDIKLSNIKAITLTEKLKKTEVSQTTNNTSTTNTVNNNHHNTNVKINNLENNVEVDLTWK